MPNINQDTASKSWFFTEAEIIEMVEQKLGTKFPADAKLQFFSSYSPDFYRWQNERAADGPLAIEPTIKRGFTLQAG